jgi:hypothetical protein
MASSTPVSLVEDPEAFHLLLARANQFGMSWSELHEDPLHEDPLHEDPLYKAGYKGLKLGELIKFYPNINPTMTPFNNDTEFFHPAFAGEYTGSISNRVLVDTLNEFIEERKHSEPPLFVEIDQNPSHCMAPGGYCSSQVYYYVAGIYKDGSERICVAVLRNQ